MMLLAHVTQHEFPTLIATFAIGMASGSMLTLGLVWLKNRISAGRASLTQEVTIR